MTDITMQIDQWGITKQNQVAITYAQSNITYGDLKVFSDLVAQKISSHKDKIPVIIVCKRSIEFIYVMLGIMKSGNCYIPIEMPYLPNRLDEILNQFESFIVIADEKYDALKKYENNTLYISEIIASEKVVLDKYNGLSENDSCYIIFTSGTSGVPKGVEILYLSLLNLVNNFLGIFFDAYENPISVGVLSSFSFDASIKQIFGALFYGHTLVIAKREDKLFSTRMQQFFSRHDIKIIDGTPTIYNILMKKKKRDNWNIDFILIGGEILYWQFVQSLSEYLNNQSNIINVYGPTECCVDAAYYWTNLSYEVKEDRVPIGKPIRNAIFSLYDEKGNLITEKGVCGELYISGILVAKGYRSNELNNVFFDDVKRGKTYKTGDIAYRDDSENYIILGRCDNQVKINGNRIELEEIESVLSKIVNGEVVVCMKNDYSKVRLYAFVHGESYINELECLKKAKKMLPSYGVPDRIIVTQRKFPITPNGKIDRKKILKICIEEGC